MSARATRCPAAPPGEASLPSGRFLVGNLVCEVTSADERYPRLLAAVYGAPMLADAGGPGSAPELRISVRDAPRPAAAPSGDRLIVRRDAGAVVLESDPMTWHVRTDVHPFRISVGIHDPGLREDWLAYQRIRLPVSRVFRLRLGFGVDLDAVDFCEVPVPALADAMRQAYETDLDVLAAKGAAGARRARERFTWSHVGDHVTRYLREAVGDP